MYVCVECACVRVCVFVVRVVWRVCVVYVSVCILHVWCVRIGLKCFECFTTTPWDGINCTGEL